VPRIVFSKARYESFDAAVRSASEFVSDCSVKVLSVATVVLPNIWKGFEGGMTDSSISIHIEKQLRPGTSSSVSGCENWTVAIAEQPCSDSGRI
jgi:hypothetical protein